MCACFAWTYAACVKGQTCTCLFILPLSFYHHFTWRKPYHQVCMAPSSSSSSSTLPPFLCRFTSRFSFWPCSLPTSMEQQETGTAHLLTPLWNHRAIWDPDSFFLGWFYPEVKKKNVRGSKCESIKISSSLWREPTTVVLWNPRCILSWGSSLKFY